MNTKIVGYQLGDDPASAHDKVADGWRYGPPGLPQARALAPRSTRWLASARAVGRSLRSRPRTFVGEVVTSTVVGFAIAWSLLEWIGGFL